MSQFQGDHMSQAAGSAADPDAPAGGIPAEPSTHDPMWQMVRRLPKYARLSTALARDPHIPKRAKALLVAGGAYLVSPIDLVPGFIPVAGQLDDLYVVLMSLRQASRIAPADVIEEHFMRAGLTQKNVDEDLAAIRGFVRRGLTWSFRNGGKALARMSRQATAAVQRARQERNMTNDQNPL